MIMVHEYVFFKVYFVKFMFFWHDIVGFNFIANIDVDKAGVVKRKLSHKVLGDLGNELEEKYGEMSIETTK